MTDIGKRIKAKREQNGLTQEELANKMGYKSKTTIAKIELGINDIVQSKVVEFAKILDTTPAYLMGWDDDNRIPDGFIPLPKTKKLPVVGAVACGAPILAEENIEEYVDMPVGKYADFALRCEGDSMIDAGIQNGDIVYIRSQPDAEDGQIAAVLIGEEATLKRVYHQPGGIVLQPANPKYPPLMFFGQQTEEVRIEGIAVGWMHWI